MQLTERQKRILREKTAREDRENAQREAYEENGHSHSAVGDQFNMGGNQE